MKKIFNGIINHIKHHKKRVIIIFVFILCISSYGIIKSRNSVQGKEISNSETTVLRKSNLVNSVSEQGVVVSSSSIEVNAQKQLPIKEILKKEGDHVNKGDVIAKLDAKSINQQLSLKKASISAASAQTASQVKSAAEKLNSAIKNKNEGTNAQIQSAKNSVTAAYNSWQNALKTYNDYKKSIDEGYNPEIISQNSSRENLNSQLETAKLNKEQSENKKTEAKDKINDCEREYEDASDEADRLQQKVNSLNEDIYRLEEKISGIQADKIQNPDKNNKNNINSIKDELFNKKSKLNSIQKELTEAESKKSKYKSMKEELENSLNSMDEQIAQSSLAYENAKNSLEDSYKQSALSSKTRMDTLKTYKQAADSAYDAYIAAVENVKISDVAANDEIQALKDQLRAARENGNSIVNSAEMKNLKEELNDTIIKAPISGTITSLPEKIGSVPSGPVAKIETLNQLQIESRVKEFDVNKIKEGMEVEITSNALNKNVKYSGKVISVNPTPMTSEKGTQNNDVYYKTVIEIEGSDKTELKAGMNVKIKYIIDQSQNVLKVPSNAIFTKGNKNFVLALKKTSGGYIVEEYEVQKGLENEFETAVSGKDIKSKLIILNSPENYNSGMEISNIKSGDEEPENR